MLQPAPTPLTAERIEQTLVRRHMSGTNLVMPTMTALGYESDVLVLTKAGYVHDIEVKVSVADFRAEFRASPFSPKWMRQEVMRAAVAGEPIPAGWVWDTPWKWQVEGAQPVTDRNAAREAAAYGRGLFAPVCPNRFTFAYPVAMHDVVAAEAPEWAGLAPLNDQGHAAMKPRRDGEPWGGTELSRPAKRLHRNRAPDHVREAMLMSAYHRYWKERRDRMEAQASRAYALDRMRKGREGS